MLRRWLLYVGSVFLGLCLVGGLLGAFVLALLYPTLPSLESLTDYHPKIPLRVVSAEGDILGEFGEERRAIVAIRDVPDVMINAILAAEDERFYSHGGVDYLSVMRAAASNLASGTQQGAGTITMQVARNFFLTREKTITRKLREVLLAWKIEANLSKDEILQLYVNQIFLGQRAYGFAAAAQIYFGKPLRDLSPAEAAMLAGLPKAPSAFNPVSNPKRAKTRQLYVLRRMHDLKYISSEQYAEAQTAPLAVRQGLRETLPTHAEFVAEMARQVVFDAYGEDAYTKGLTVQTTIRKADQEAAYLAVRRGVIDYDHRHGYRGPEAYVSLPDDAAEREATLEQVFAETGDGDGLSPAVVTEASPATGQGRARRRRSRRDRRRRPQVRRPVAWRQGCGGDQGPVRRDHPPRARCERQVGDHPVAAGGVRVRLGAATGRRDPVARRRLRASSATSSTTSPRPSASRVRHSSPSSTRPRSKKASRPRRSSTMRRSSCRRERGGEDWEPKNYDGKFDGPMRIRAALAKSKNLVTVRVMQAIGPQYAQDYIARFGFDPKLHPPYLPMALGAGAATPMQMVSAYSIFANGGYRISPYLIARIIDAKGNVISEANPAEAGGTAERAIDPRNAWIMTSLLKDVVRAGTATRALSLNRADLAGKTGTTNENVDAWFCGFNADDGRRRMDRVRSAEDTGRERDGRQRGPADLDFVYGEGAEGHEGGQPADARGHRHAQRSTPRPAFGTTREPSPNTSLAEFPPRSRDDSLTSRASPARTYATSSSRASTRSERAPSRPQGRPRRRAGPARGSPRSRPGSSSSTASPTGRSPSARQLRQLLLPDTTRPAVERRDRSGAHRASRAVRRRSPRGEPAAPAGAGARMDASARAMGPAARRRRRGGMGDRAQRRPAGARRRRPQGRGDGLSRVGGVAYAALPARDDDAATHLRIDSPRGAVRIAILTPAQRRNRPRARDEEPRLERRSASPR